MDDFFAKCGCDCKNCPTYKENIRNIEGRIKCSDGWNKYLGIRLSPEKLRACDGCSIPDEDRGTFYLNCSVRKCAIINGLDNCAFCTGFPCNDLNNVHSLQQIRSRKDFIRKTGKQISEGDYGQFIEPYAGLDHLSKIRKNLNKKDYKEFKKFSTKTNFVPYEKMFDKPEIMKIIYSFLTTLYVEEDVSFARLHTLNYKREKTLKLLWTMGLFGSFDRKKGFIELDARSFLSQKITGMYHKLIEFSNELKERDIRLDIIPVIKQGWMTDSGALRKEGWIIRLSFGKSLKGSGTLSVFIDYVRKLHKLYGKKAFQAFNRADLSVMTNDTENV
jgi:hypothetical protein